MNPVLIPQNLINYFFIIVRHTCNNVCATCSSSASVQDFFSNSFISMQEIVSAGIIYKSGIRNYSYQKASKKVYLDSITNNEP